MAMQPVYLVAVKNLAKFLEALRHAQAPEKVALRFIEELGFTSTNDRLFIPMLKAMKFLDDGGKPTARYHSFLDDTQWKQVLAEGIRDAYPDLFRVNRNAHTLSREQVTGKIKSLTEGKLSQAIVLNTTKTFLELVKLADFRSALPDQAQPEDMAEEPAETERTAAIAESRAGGEDRQRSGRVESSSPTLVYRIEIVLPAVRDQAIYDAIFRSAKEHLLK